MFRLKKLNARGFAHHFLIAVVVVGVAVGGTYYLIASHADSCSDPTSGATADATSAPVTSPACTPVTSPVTSPVTAPTLPPTPPPAYNGQCAILGVTTVVKKGSVVSPKVAITNLGTQAFTVNMDFTLTPNGAKVISLGHYSGSLASNAGTLQSLGTYTVPKNTSYVSAVLSARDSDAKTGFSCSKQFVITK
jgi:hypothetical protein